MSNIQLIIEERATSIGKFTVGPFIYIDPIGPYILEGNLKSAGKVTTKWIY